jgi:hypothetical protein
MYRLFLSPHSSSVTTVTLGSRLFLILLQINLVRKNRLFFNLLQINLLDRKKWEHFFQTTPDSFHACGCRHIRPYI